MSSSSKHSAGQLHLLDLSEASRAVQKKEVSPVELTQACLARIEKLNPHLNAFITITGTERWKLPAKLKLRSPVENGKGRCMDSARRKRPD